MPTDLVLFEGEKFELGFNNVININSIKSSQGFNIAQASNEWEIRAIIEHKKADIILIEHQREKDFSRQRASGLNHILCAMAYRNSIAIAFSFRDVLEAEGRVRYNLIGRMMQNIKLCRKYKVRMVFATFARNKWQMRNYSDLLSFARTIGMTSKEAAQSFVLIDEIIENRKKFVREGVRRL